MLRIKNNGEARTVDFLAVFNKGETRDFTDAEIAMYEAMNGTPFEGGKYLPEGFKVTTIKDGSAVDPEAAALKQQEEDLAKLNALAVTKTGEVPLQSVTETETGEAN
jgi:hypothetical protein